MEKIKLPCACVLVLIFNLSLVCGQYVQSPCPGVFDYESDGSSIYGRIVLRPGTPVSQLVLQGNFTVQAKLFSNYFGNLELENERFALQSYNRGSPMRYRVHFPVTSPLPRLTWLAVNGETLCSGPGDVLRPNQYLTTFSLQHTTYIRGGGQSFLQTQPPQSNNFVGGFGDNTQVYFEGVDNSWNNNVDNNWNNGSSPYYIVNTVRPPVYRPNRPVYEDTSRPSSPSFGNQNFNESPQRPPANRPVNRPIYTPPPTQPPVYEEPVTQPQRPQRPTQAETFYYPEGSLSEEPNLVTTRPVVQQTSSTSNIECGVVGGKLPLIVQGTPYSRGDVPWLVAIYKNRQNNLSFICGGTLVSDRHVITAAHCMHLRSVQTAFTDIVVKVGVYDLSAWDDDSTVTRTLIGAKFHESYNSSSLQNDILVLTFRLRVTFNDFIRPACLWSGDTALQRIVGIQGIVAGWGEQYNGGPKPGVPHMVHLPVVNTDTCRARNAAFHKLTSSHTLCAGDLKGSGPCKGDSGGGLYIRHEGKWRIRGVVSISLRNSDGMCNLNEYLVFTDTAQYLPWIRDILNGQD